MSEIERKKERESWTRKYFEVRSESGREKNSRERKRDNRVFFLKNL